MVDYPLSNVIFHLVLWLIQSTAMPASASFLNNLGDEIFSRANDVGDFGVPALANFSVL